MSYYQDVYLKRLNLHGTNKQDRIKSYKEREFEKLFLKDSEYKSYILQINDQTVDQVCSLEPNRWNESNLYSNLLIPTSVSPLKAGDLLQIRQKIKKIIQEKIWLVLFAEQNLTQGYQLYKLVCLDSHIDITDEYGTTIFTTPTKIINAAQSFMQDTIIKSAAEYGYREPQTTHIAIVQDSEELKKGQYFNYSDRGWEIVGIDNISVPGVGYLYLSERLKVENEPLSSQDIMVGEDENFFLIGR